MPRRREHLDEVDLKILDFFRQVYVKERRYPTVREVLQALEGRLNSESSVQYRLERLVEKGYLRKYAGLKRASRPYALVPMGIPVLGHIVASGNTHRVYTEDYYNTWMEGSWDPDHLDKMDWIQVDGLDIQFPSDRYFALRVKGDSMVDEHILDNDVVVFRRIELPPERPNVLVAVYLKDEEWLSIKRFGGTSPENAELWRLYPANRAAGYLPIDVPKAHTQFQGEAVLVLRDLAPKPTMP